jgi:predicted RNase H-like nuclease
MISTIEYKNTCLMQANITLIGLDAAVQDGDFGYAIGEFNGADKPVKIRGAGSLRDVNSALKSIVSAIDAANKVLIAVDAPLGWPTRLRDALDKHVAGTLVSQHADDIFRRQTDKLVQKVVGNRSFDVGADRIARTAHRALRFIQSLREMSAQSIDLAWSNSWAEKCALIEVYPAATLRSRRLPHRKYKNQEYREARTAIADGLKRLVPELDNYVSAQADIFDACLCLLAARDFLCDEAMRPTADMVETAALEGWIWVRKPSLALE